MLCVINAFRLQSAIEILVLPVFVCSSIAPISSTLFLPLIMSLAFAMGDFTAVGDLAWVRCRYRFSETIF